MSLDQLQQSDSHLEHPSEDSLERFLLHQASDAELETIETHILACESCVDRLEILELEIAATKLALAELHQEKTAEEYAKAQNRRKSWFSIKSLSWAATAAAIVLGVISLPLLKPADVNLAAYRGSETTFVPEWRPLHLHANTTGLDAKEVVAEVVDVDGNPVWKGTTSVDAGHADIALPRLTHSGSYLLRLYAANGNGNPLREFSFQTK
jgi:hypothetical protein